MKRFKPRGASSLLSLNSFSADALDASFITRFVFKRIHREFSVQSGLLSKNNDNFFSSKAPVDFWATLIPKSLNERIFDPTPSVKAVISHKNFSYKEVLRVGLDQDLPRLKHGLESVLFRPGVHLLHDTKENVFNFPSYLSKLPDVTKINRNSFRSFTPPLQDARLLKLSNENGCKYASSTSSVTHMLSRIHQMVYGYDIPQMDEFSSVFDNYPKTLTRFQRFPTSITLTKYGSTYIVQKDDFFDNTTVLSILGGPLENLLTKTKEDFEQTHLITGALSNQHACPKLKNAVDPELAQEFFYYGSTGSFLMRAQLDGTHPSLPRRSFDIKTRATLPIRMDVENYWEHLRYELSNFKGLFNSFEREYFDMIRASFLRHAFQVRIGNMDGIFVAYHNTQRFFGFQYFKSECVDKFAFNGAKEGDIAFAVDTQILELLLNKVTADYPNEKRLRVVLEPGTQLLAPVMYAKPLPEINEFGKPIPKASPPPLLSQYLLTIGRVWDSKAGAAASGDVKVEISKPNTGEDVDIAYQNVMNSYKYRGRDANRGTYVSFLRKIGTYSEGKCDEGVFDVPGFGP